MFLYWLGTWSVNSMILRICTPHLCSIWTFAFWKFLTKCALSLPTLWICTISCKTTWVTTIYGTSIWNAWGMYCNLFLAPVQTLQFMLMNTQIILCKIMDYDNLAFFNIVLTNQILMEVPWCKEQMQSHVCK